MKKKDNLKYLYKSTFSLLNSKSRKKILFSTLIQIAGGALDLIGVALFGLLGALAVSGVESKRPTGKVAQFLDIFHLDTFTIQNQAAVIALIATLILIIRSIFSILFTRKVMRFLNNQTAILSVLLTSKSLNRDITNLHQKSFQEMNFATSHGVRVLLVGILGNTIVLISDMSLVIVMLLGLFYVDPLIALSTSLCFGFIGLFMYKILHLRSKSLGELESNLDIQASSIYQQAFLEFREASVLERKNYYVESIKELRFKLAGVLAEISFIPQISKYVIESTVLLMLLIIGAIQFAIEDAPHAVATLSVMLAASTRIAPAVLRAQQGAVQIKGSFGYAQPTLDLIKETELVEPLSEMLVVPKYSHDGFDPSVSFKNITYTYPGASKPAISDLTLNINTNDFVAIVGHSGAGKSTLVDLLLGLITPDKGTIQISGVYPGKAITTWPGAIGYVPQNVNISNLPVTSNIALGLPESLIDLNRVKESMRMAKVDFLGDESRNRLQSGLGENGGKLSGGQRQRIGIARALYTAPKLLILDEATSALDGKTEMEIGNTLQELAESTTIVVIAHRLSTIRNANKVIYLQDGKLIASGTIDEVRRQIPDFDLQAKQMGLQELQD